MKTTLLALTVLLFALPAAAAEAPRFSLAWSEYPSWSTFGVAHELKLIDGKPGAMGPIETKWGVDIVLKEAEYDPCLQMYGAGQCDAVCITNMDVLNPSLSVPSVAVAPTSTSFGADACIVSKGIAEIKDLRGKKIYGLAMSVSEYCFSRNLELLGEKDKDYTFVNMDPGAAALAMQQGQAGYDAIVVWNPFVMETLNKRKDAKVLFDSTAIPGEIVDMLVVSQKSFAREGGPAFAAALCDTFYAVCDRMADPLTKDDTLVALGEKFSHLNLQAMRTVCEQTKFYATPEAGLAVYTSPEFAATMDKVVGFCVGKTIVPRKPVLAYGAGTGETNLRFAAEILEKVAGSRKAAAAPAEPK